MKYKLLDNSYAFINEAILNSRKAKRNSQYWSFAILHTIQGLELLLKHILRQEHPILVYENIDKPKNTVNLSKALERLIAIAEVDIDENEKKIIQSAINQRNMIVHFEYDLKPEYYKNIFLQLFEFIHYFHHKHIGAELHDFIDDKLWRTEAELLADFKNQWVTYRGQKMVNYYPFEIIISQKYNCLRINRGKEFGYYERYKFGDGPNNEVYGGTCPDCAVNPGEYHTFGCDIETCPICGWQLLSCNCDANPWIQRNQSLIEPRKL